MTEKAETAPTSKPRYSKFVVYLPAGEAGKFLKQLAAEARRLRITRSEVLRDAFWKTVEKVE